MVKNLDKQMKQLGVDVRDVLGIMRTSANFIGSFRTKVLQEIARRGMY